MGALAKVSVLLGTLIAVFIQITPDPIAERLDTPTVSAKDAVWSTGNAIKIHAQADEVWKKLTAFDKYPEWSTRVPRIDWEGPLKVGTNGTVTPKLPGKKPKKVPIVITSYDPEIRRIAWKTRVNPTWLMDSEGAQQVIEIPGEPGWCEYRSWHSWAGPLSYILKWTHKNWTGELRDDWMLHDFKPYMEKK